MEGEEVEVEVGVAEAVEVEEVSGEVAAVEVAKEIITITTLNQNGHE